MGDKYVALMRFDSEERAHAARERLEAQGLRPIVVLREEMGHGSMSGVRPIELQIAPGEAAVAADIIDEWEEEQDGDSEPPLSMGRKS